MTTQPVPRFDLLGCDKYTSMSVQFSRGCPFQCEFCDIITIYGRKPRAKTPDADDRASWTPCASLGWRNEVFIVDDNFIGNLHKRCAGARRTHRSSGSAQHHYPFSFYYRGLASTSPTSLSCSTPWCAPTSVRLHRHRNAVVRSR